MLAAFSSLALVLSVLVHLAYGAPNLDSGYVHKVKESIESPRGWVKGEVAPSNNIIQLRIALPQPNFPVLEKHLYEVSDPRHERYGQHLSKEEVEEFVAPHPESIDLVDAWLVSHGLNKADFQRSPAKDWIYVNVPVRLAETMLNTVSTLVHISTQSIFSLFIRLTMYGGMKKAAMHTSELSPTVCHKISTIT